VTRDETIRAPRRRRNSSARWLVAALLFGAIAARGDGGRLQLNQIVGPFEVALFTAPTPLRAGAIDVSLLVQEAGQHTPVLDAQVTLVARAENAIDGERVATAVRGAATNKLFYTALIDIPAPGRWRLTADVRAGERAASVSCAVDIAPPQSPLVAFWGYLALPAVAIALFALHQWLKRSVVSRRSSVG
jgi:hypothetical protein